MEWVDFVKPVECPDLTFKISQTPNKKFFEMTATIPYDASKQDDDIYRRIITHMRWIRTVFDNPNCDETGFIIKRSRESANSLEATSQKKTDLEGAVDIIRQIVNFRLFKPFSVSNVSTPFVAYKCCKYNGETNFVGKDVENSFVFQLNSALDVKVMVYPDRNSKDIVFVACGKPDAAAKAVALLVRANDRINDGVDETTAFEESLKDAMVKPEDVPESDRWIDVVHKKKRSTLSVPKPAPVQVRVLKRPDPVALEVIEAALAPFTEASPTPLPSPPPPPVQVPMLPISFDINHLSDNVSHASLVRILNDLKIGLESRITRLEQHTAANRGMINHLFSAQQMPVRTQYF